MKQQPIQQKQDTHANETHAAPESEGKSMAPPAFQLMASSNDTPSAPPVQRKENSGGLSNDLVSGFQASTGHDLSDVNVHKNSSKPSEVGALAYAQGNDIHLGAGQEQHLPHEAAHIVQQREGRVKPTTEVAGKPVNDNAGLESEADRMGAVAQAKAGNGGLQLSSNGSGGHSQAPLQAKVAQFWPDKATTHLKDQASSRGISEVEVDNAVANGDQYEDPDYVGGTVYFDTSTGVAVCKVAGGVVTTCYRRGGPKGKWVRK